MRVDVSLDGGKTWANANLNKPDVQVRDQVWGWTPWKIELDVPEELRGQPLEVCAKAVDSCYNCQPDTVEPIWNLRGVLCNAWSRVTVVPAPPEEDE